MFKSVSVSDIWVDDEAVAFLQATNGDIESLKQLRLIQLKQKYRQTEKQNFQIPSIIIDEFLYHGTIEQARNVSLLETLGIRHIINVSHIRLTRDMINNYNILWINIHDDEDVNIREHFDRTNEFLQACRSKNQKVLVHCRRGVSRSSAIVLAYLLKYHHYTLDNAYEHLVERRFIAIPNDSFFLQLIRYENDMHINKNMNVEQNSNESISPETFPLTFD